MSDVLAPDELYERDFHGWTQQQAEILRRAAEQRLNAPAGLDRDHLAQEVWELGLSLELEVYHRHVILPQHLLKRRHQPRLRSGSWRGSISEQRRRSARLLRKNPGLKPKRAEEFAEAYDEVLERAADETGLPLATFPTACPFSLFEVESPDFWPEDGPET